MINNRYIKQIGLAFLITFPFMSVSVKAESPISFEPKDIKFKREPLTLGALHPQSSRGFNYLESRRYALGLRLNGWTLIAAASQSGIEDRYTLHLGNGAHWMWCPVQQNVIKVGSCPIQEPLEPFVPMKPGQPFNFNIGYQF